MKRYRLVRGVFGGSDVYDEDGRQVGYSLPAGLGGGEDFYDMEGNPVGQSFESAFGGESFIGMGNGSSGFMDEEILMGRNAWLNGDPFRKEETEASEVFGLDCMDHSDIFDLGDDSDSDMSWNNGGF